VQSADRDTTLFRALAQVEPALSWYAIADSAQHSALPRAIAHESAKSRCLLGAPEGSPLAQKSPHLVQLSSPLHVSNAWSWIALNARPKPCISIMATVKPFEEVFEQLSTCTDVVLPDGEEMVLAFWDPAILGTLLGQTDDQTLHVKGPVLKPQQRIKMMGDLKVWWYWDRVGNIHSIAPDGTVCQSADGPLVLSQEQVDDLVEASVPDHVLYYIKLNQPHLLEDVISGKRYSLVSHALNRARDIGLRGMRDLVNYVCVELIYKERMREAAVKRVFDDVKNGRIEFDAALDQLP
jgi:hypothetical protein